MLFTSFILSLYWWNLRVIPWYFIHQWLQYSHIMVLALYPNAHPKIPWYTPKKTQNLILQESRNGESTVETHTDCGVENYRLRLLDQPTDNVSYSKNTLKLIVSVKNSVFLETQCSSSWVQPPSWGAFTHNALRNGTYLAILAQWFILSSHVWKKHRVTKAEERSKASRRQENHILHTHTQWQQHTDLLDENLREEWIIIWNQSQKTKLLFSGFRWSSRISVDPIMIPVVWSQHNRALNTFLH